MPPVLTTCPTTGLLVPTGIVVDDADELDVVGHAHVLEVCPNCGGNHVWTSADAVVLAKGTSGTPEGNVPPT